MPSTPVMMGAFAALTVVCIVVVLLFTRWRAAQQRARLDAWVRGAFSLWTGGEDSGTWEVARAQSALASWYGVADGSDLSGVIDELRHGQTGNPAWDQVRALDLLRIGIAAKYIDEDDYRSSAAEIGTDLQRMYPSWEALAAAFEQGMNAWQARRNITDPAETGRVQRNLAKLRSEVWPQVRYAGSLQLE